MTSRSPRLGDVYLVSDDALSLPPIDDCKVHRERRPVVVLSGETTNSDPAWLTVLVVPLSSSTTRKTRYCVKLGVGDGNLTKKTWARVPAVQPLAKGHLQDFTGSLPADKLEQIQARVLEYMGLIDEDV
jgi:mRNA-degrading endonuclease toxin of MazEF toxin-antitoxin module